MLRILSFFIATSLTLACHSQKPFEFGGEYMRFIGQGYNNAKAGLRGESFTNKSSFSAGITYQLASKKAYSVSHGFGLYIGYRYAFSDKMITTGSSPFAGARVLFSLENFEGKTSQNSLLITPFTEAGYHLIFAKRMYAAPSVGYGYTLNIGKDYNSMDEDNGARIIPSLSAGFRF